MQYREFSVMKPTKFRRDKDPIISLRWISTMEGCFLYIFMSRGPEGEICAEFSSMGCERLVGVCDSGVFVGRTSCSDLEIFFRDISCNICSTCGERVIGTGVHVAQADDRLGN